MDASALLWKQWQHQVKDLFGQMHGHQKKTLAFFVIGIVLSGTAVLQRMAEGLSEHGISRAKMPSIERRLARFIANSRIEVEAVWMQFVAQVLPFWRDKPLRFVLDMTPFNEHATVIYVGLLVHSRLLPVAWCTMPGQTTWPMSQWRIVERLLDGIIPYLGKAECTDDSQIEAWWECHWSRSARREDGITCYGCERRIPVAARWASVFAEPGRALIPSFASAQIVGRDVPSCGKRNPSRPTSVPIGTQSTRKLGCSFLISPPVVLASATMRCECGWKPPGTDQKSRGSHLEGSSITHLARLDRLILGLFVAMWWVCHLAASCMHHGERHRGCLAMIAATKAFSAWDGSGCLIFFVEHPAPEPCVAVSHSPEGKMDGCSLYAFKKCQGESPNTPKNAGRGKRAG